jgi:PPOX class probable F420-dependent enzyme
MFDRLRDKRAFALTEDDAIDAELESLRGNTYAVLVTFRRDGDPVPSPVWFAVDDAGLAYVKTRHDAGKVKRLRNDPRVLIAPSSSRGKPAGRAIKASGRVLPHDEWAHAERVLAAAYGSSRAITERLIGGPDELAAYLEIRRDR